MKKLFFLLTVLELIFIVGCNKNSDLQLEKDLANVDQKLEKTLVQSNIENSNIENSNIAKSFYYFDKVEFTQSDKSHFLSTLESKGLNFEDSINVTKFKITKEDSFRYLVMFKPNNYAIINDIENFDKSILFYSMVKHENNLKFTYYLNSEISIGSLIYNFDDDSAMFNYRNKIELNLRNRDCSKSCLEHEFTECMNRQYNTSTFSGWLTIIATGFEPWIGVIAAAGCGSLAYELCCGNNG